MPQNHLVKQVLTNYKKGVKTNDLIVLTLKIACAILPEVIS